MNFASAMADTYYSREEFRRRCEAQTTGRYERMDGRRAAQDDVVDRGQHPPAPGGYASTRQPLALGTRASPAVQNSLKPQ